MPRLVFIFGLQGEDIKHEFLLLFYFYVRFFPRTHVYIHTFFFESTIFRFAFFSYPKYPLNRYVGISI